MSHSNTHQPSASQTKKVLLQVTGSIAAFKAAALASKLVQAGYQLEVVLTEGAEAFIGAASFEGLTRKPVHRGLYEPGKMMAHIDLERWADLILTYPATANTLATLASGRSDSLIGSIFLAHEFKKPYWIAPAMNQAMFKHPATQAHIQSLKNWGIHLIQPDAGALACGEIGPGRLVEPEAMLKHIQDYFAQPAEQRSPAAEQQKAGKNAHIRVLVTSGGTTEPIDAVRSITNFSTGETGYTMAKALWHQGYDVTFIQARSSHFQAKHEPYLRTLSFNTTREFSDTVKKELQSHEYHYLVHAAAVADYRVEVAESGKIQKNEPFTMKLIPNEKVLKSVRSWSKNPKMKVISFKLTAGNSDLKLESYDSEWIIHNELKNITGERHGGTLFEKSKLADRYTPLAHFSTKTELANLLIKLVEKDER